MHIRALNTRRVAAAPVAGCAPAGEYYPMLDWYDACKYANNARCHAVMWDHCYIDCRSGCSLWDGCQVDYS